MERKPKKDGRAVPNERWEVKVSPGAPSKNMKDTQGSDFNAMPAKNRKTVYVKVNETDY